LSSDPLREFSKLLILIEWLSLLLGGALLPLISGTLGLSRVEPDSH
jgi:hypothetical protein